MPSTKPQSERERIQYAFTAHVRDPQHHAAPVDVEDRRMAIYRDLLYNNVAGFIANVFPVLKKLYADAHWQRMVRDFFARHKSRTPLFAEIAQEFLQYLQSERAPQPEDPPFLIELAHYEWVELALSISEDEPDWSAIHPQGDLLAGNPVVSPLAWLLEYRYPVHRIGPDFQPEQPDAQSTYLMVYRDREDAVRFMVVNPVTARLIALIETEPDKTGEALLETIAAELRHPRPEVVMQGGAQSLRQLHASGVLLGTRR